MQGELLERAERNRVAALSQLDPRTRDCLGQFFTPVQAARLIASMPRLPVGNGLRVLDPGAGSGMLSAALVARMLDERPGVSVHVVAVECDKTTLPHLADTLAACSAAGAGRVTHEIIEADYIAASTGPFPTGHLTGFDLVVQNPPYAKLAASSPVRAAVRDAATDTPNLYAAFLALAPAALQTGGQLVAITPRSFCNGPYFDRFRSYLLDQLALDRVHVFESRSTVFADTGVRQENVVFAGTKGGDRRRVLLSSSNGHADDVFHREVDYADVVHPDDPHRFVRLATNAADTAVAERMLSLPATLASLGITVSTGRVVDFRARECLLSGPAEGAVPLVYPGNLRDGLVSWPREIGKPQWFRPVTERDEKLLVPRGWYCVVKRFSAKEEHRRVVAAVWSPEQGPGPVAFENHVNVFHAQGEGLDRDTAFGLSTWLNSSCVDRFFRTFSGHTQVNATDLRTLRLPDFDSLRELGVLIPERPPAQAEIDTLVDKVLDAMTTSARVARSSPRDAPVRA